VTIAAACNVNDVSAFHAIRIGLY